MNINSLLENKIVLYITIFLAISNMLGYLALGDYNSIVFFILIGTLVYFLNKNIILILLSALIVTNIFAISNKTYLKSEIENKDEDTEGFENAEGGNSEGESKTVSSNETVDISQETKGDLSKLKDTLKFNEDESKNLAGGPNVSNITNSAPYNDTEEDDEKEGNRIDYGATLKSSYGNLNQILGKDGVESLSKEASKLADDQKLLMENMNKLQEMMPQMNELMNNMGGIDKMMGSVKDVLGNTDIMSSLGNVLNQNSGSNNVMGNPADLLKNIGSLLDKKDGGVTGA